MAIGAGYLQQNLLLEGRGEFEKAKGEATEVNGLSIQESDQYAVDKANVKTSWKCPTPDIFSSS